METNKTHLIMLQFDPQHRLMRWDDFTTWDFGDSIGTGSQRWSVGYRTDRWRRTKQKKALAWAPMNCELPYWIATSHIDVQAAWQAPRITLASNRPMKIKVSDFSYEHRKPVYMMARPVPDEVFKIYVSRGYTKKIVRDADGKELYTIHVPKGDIEIMRDAIIDQLKNSGHVVVDEDQEITVSGDLMQFDVRTAWDEATAVRALAAIDIELSIAWKEGQSDKLVRRYRSEAIEKINDGGARPASYESALRSSIEGILVQIASDSTLADYLTQDRSKVSGKEAVLAPDSGQR